MHDGEEVNVRSGIIGELGRSGPVHASGRHSMGKQRLLAHDVRGVMAIFVATP
jgi:hypothetical protein